MTKPFINNNLENITDVKTKWWIKFKWKIQIIKPLPMVKYLQPIDKDNH